MGYLPHRPAIRIDGAGLPTFVATARNVGLALCDRRQAHPIPGSAENPVMPRLLFDFTDANAVQGWARAVPFALGPDAWEQLPHVKRLLDTVNERPAAQRTALLKDKHIFKIEMDDEARRAMFPHLAHAQA